MRENKGGGGGPKRQANFLLPEGLLAELRSIVPAKMRSKVVAAALERELARMKLEAALGEYFGAWKTTKD